MKIKYYIVAFASLLLTSCSDFLDLTPISEASSANYYKNTSDITLHCPLVMVPCRGPINMANISFPSWS